MGTEPGDSATESNSNFGLCFIWDHAVIPRELGWHNSSASLWVQIPTNDLNVGFLNYDGEHIFLKPGINQYCPELLSELVRDGSIL